MSDGQTPSGQTWVCRADFQVYGSCNSPVGSLPGHNGCGPVPPAPSSDTPADELAPIGPDGVPTNCSPETCATTPSRHCCLNDYDDPAPSSEVSERVRVGMAMKWAPMLGREVPDHNTGIDLLLMSDGTVRWEPFAAADREEGAEMSDFVKPPKTHPSCPECGRNAPEHAPACSHFPTPPTPSPVPGERPWLCVHTLSESDPCEATNPHRGCIWANAPAPSAPDGGPGLRGSTGYATTTPRVEEIEPRTPPAPLTPTPQPTEEADDA